MRQRVRIVARGVLVAAAFSTVGAARQPRTGPNEDELEQAQREVPKLAKVLELEPGMVVADIGAGFGAWTIVMARWLGPTGRVYSTDVAPAQLAALRATVAREELTNVVVLEGAEASANLPRGCCDAILMRDVYHHLKQPEAFNASILATLKTGGRLAIVDFEPKPGSKIFDGVPANRGGHGIPAPVVLDELTAAGLEHVRTFLEWPPDANPPEYFLALFRKP